MTEAQRQKLRIPTREEFHRSYAGYISCKDFSASHTAGFAARETVKAMLFNDECRKKINYSNMERG